MCIRAVNTTPAGGGKSAVSHTHICIIIYTHTHTHTGTLGNPDIKIQRETDTHSLSQVNRDEPISRGRKSAWQRERNGGSRKEWGKWKNTLKQSVCRQQDERKKQLRHLHTLTLSGKLRWPEANPSWHSGRIMWRDVWRERDRQGWHSLILFVEWHRRKEEEK